LPQLCRHLAPHRVSTESLIREMTRVAATAWAINLAQVSRRDRRRPARASGERRDGCRPPQYADHLGCAPELRESLDTTRCFTGLPVDPQRELWRHLRRPEAMMVAI